MIKKNRSKCGGITARERMFQNDIDIQSAINKNYEEEEVEEKLKKVNEILDILIDENTSSFEKFKADLYLLSDFDHNFTFITVLRKKMNHSIFNSLISIVNKSIHANVFLIGNDGVKRSNIERIDERYEEEALNLLLKTLKIIFLIQPKIIHGLNNLNLLFTQIFTLFKQKTTTLKRQKLCIDLMEFFIEGSDFYFNLLKVQQVRDFIESADHSLMAHFTKVLALLVLDVKKVKNPFKKQPSQYEETLLSINGFMQKTIDICFFLTRITINISNCTNQIQLQDVLRNLDQSHTIQFSNFDVSPFQVISDKTILDVQQYFTPNYLLELCLKSSNLTEILFLISNILQGKRKKEIQSELNKIGFIEQIFNPLYAVFFKHINTAQNQNGSDLLQTSRIQLLRSIINFCDSDESNKSLKDRMISFEERDYARTNILPELIVDYNSEIDLSEQIENIKWENIIDQKYDCNLFKNIKNKGTINLLITTYFEIDKSNNLSIKFWIASCIETFLRGSNQYHQIMILFYGLQHQITDKLFLKNYPHLNINNNNGSTNEQSSESQEQQQQLEFLNENEENKKKDPEEQILMDLMGEFIKYNIINIRYFYQYLYKKNLEDKFISIIQNNIVDSNVFLRSLWITQSKLQTQQIHGVISKYRTYEKLNEFLVEWILLIIKTMSVQQLSQDNICCMNTLILIYLFAWNQGDDQESLIIQKIKEVIGTSSPLKEKISDCFEQWENYYYFRGKDSFGLSYSTKIPFFYYQISKRRMCELLELQINKNHSIHNHNNQEYPSSPTHIIQQVSNDSTDNNSNNSNSGNNNNNHNSSGNSNNNSNNNINSNKSTPSSPVKSSIV